MKAKENKFASKKANPLICSCVGVCKEKHGLAQRLLYYK